MAWLTAILAIIQAIPTIIKIVQMLRDAMKDQPAATRAQYSKEIKGAITQWRVDGDTPKAVGNLKDVLSNMYIRSKFKQKDTN